MPIIFRYKGFEIRFWYVGEEDRRHVHAIKNGINVKIWLEPEIEVAKITGKINSSLVNELLNEVKKHENDCHARWDDFQGL